MANYPTRKELKESKYAPPIGRLSERDVPNPDVGAAKEANQPGPALVPKTSPGPVPADHHVLPLVEPLHELQPLAIHHTTARDPNVARVLRHHHVPSPRLPRVVLHSLATQERGAFSDFQNDAGSQEDRGRQVLAGREGDAAWGTGAAVDGRLDGGRVVVEAVADGPEGPDGEGDWVGVNGEWELEFG
jgi:hypothetical protein